MVDLFAQLRQFVTPPSWDSWKALIWISIFSWAVSMLTNGFIQAFIASVGWIFLIPGLHWFMHEEKLKLFGNVVINVKKNLTFGKLYFAPWITGGLVCIYLFGGLLDTLPSAVFVCWPPISAAIAVAPKFIKFGPEYKIPDPPVRQEIVILMLWNLLISCWLQLYFFTQYWLYQYPSLLTDDLSNSAFVYQVRPADRPVSRGNLILNQAETILRDSLAGQSWAQVEKWLLNLNQQLDIVRLNIFERLSSLQENSYWRLEGRVLPGTEYTVQINAIWQGPTATTDGYYLTKTCQVTRVANVRAELSPPNKPALLNPVQQVKVECGPASGPIAGLPPSSNR